MRQRILITGGTGLLGAYMVRWFARQPGTEVTATFHRSDSTIPEDIRTSARWVPLQLPDRAAALDLVKGHTHVIHTAGKISYHSRDKFRMLDIHQTGTAHIVDACLAHDIRHLIYISSISALGKEKSPVVVNETTPWMDNEYSTSYGLSKYLGELEVWRGAGEGLNVSVILPSVILGTGNWETSSLQLLDRIAHKAPFYPAGQTGWVDVRDVVQFISCLIDQSVSGERWLISGADLTFADMYRKLSALLGLKRHFRPAPMWMARMILLAGKILGQSGLGPEILRQSYGTFSFDASKSLTVPGFHYRDLDQTLSEITDAYRNPAQQPYLPF